MNPGVRLGAGRSAEVFAWGEREVLKLYYPDLPQQWVEYEAEVAGIARAQGIPTPAISGLHRYRDRIGIVFERVEGPSLWRVMLTRPWRIPALIEAFARLHHAIHGCRVDGLASQHRRISQMVSNAADTRLSERRRLAANLRGRVSGHRLCHNDFHPANVLLGPNGAVAIDWMKATRGEPRIDVAITAFKLAGPRERSSMTPMRRWVVGPGGRWLSRLYLDCYARVSGHDDVTPCAETSEMLEAAFRRDYRYPPDRAREIAMGVYHSRGLGPARDWLDRAIEHGYSSEEHLARIGFSLFRRQHPEVALEYGERALAISPEREALGRSMGRVRARIAARQARRARRAARPRGRRLSAR